MFFNRSQPFRRAPPVRIVSPIQSFLSKRVARRLSPLGLRRFRLRRRNVRSSPTRFDRLLTRFYNFVRLMLKFWATHVLLVFFLGAYAVGGALIFEILEAPGAPAFHDEAIDKRKQVVEALWIDCQHAEVRDKVNWTKNFKSALWGNSEYLCMPDVWKEDDEKMAAETWTLTSAIVFSSSTFTTIGYGYATPRTKFGQLFTIVFSCFGIPYNLFVLADMGQVLQNILKSLYISGYKFYYLGTCCKRKFTPPSVTVNRWLTRLPCFSNEQTVTSGENIYEVGHGSSAMLSSYSGDDSLYVLGGLRESDFVVPVKLGLVILVLYVALGAVFFTLYEDWDYHGALYFIFTSLSTIGYGDVMPENTNGFFVFIYIFIGLILMSLVFTLLLGYASRIVTKAQRKITRAWTAKITEVEEVEEPVHGSIEEEVMVDDECGRLLDVFVLDSLSVMQLSKPPSPTDLLKPQSSSSQAMSMTKTFDQPVVLIQINDSRLMEYTLPDLNSHFSGDEALLSAARDAVVGSRRARRKPQLSPTQLSPRDRRKGQLSPAQLSPREPQLLHITEAGLFEYMKERMAQVKGLDSDTQEQSFPARGQYDVPSPNAPRKTPGSYKPRDTSSFRIQTYQKRVTSPSSVVSEDTESYLPPWKPLARFIPMREASNTDLFLRTYESRLSPVRMSPRKEASFVKVPEAVLTSPHPRVRTYFDPGPSESTQTIPQASTSSAPWNSPKNKKEKAQVPVMKVPKIRVEPPTPPPESQENAPSSVTSSHRTNGAAPSHKSKSALPLSPSGSQKSEVLTPLSSELAPRRSSPAILERRT